MTRVTQRKHSRSDRQPPGGDTTEEKAGRVGVTSAEIDFPQPWQIRNPWRAGAFTDRVCRGWGLLRDVTGCALVRNTHAEIAAFA